MNQDPENDNFHREYLEEALAVIDAQSELLAKMGINVRNARKGSKDSQKAILKLQAERERWTYRAMQSEARISVLRDKIWAVEEMFRNVGYELREKSLFDIADKKRDTYRSRQKFEQILDRELNKELEKEKTK